MKLTFDRWKFAFFDLVAPPACVGCGVRGVVFCRDCLDRSPAPPALLCEICGNPVEGGPLCGPCRLVPPVFRQARFSMVYTQPFRGLIMQLKYAGDRSTGLFLADLAIDSLAQLGWPVDIGISVPLNAEKKRTRGYNQVDLFAGPLAERLGIGYMPNAIERVKETRSQVGLSHSERRLNLKAAFRAHPEKVRAKKVLLFDDVFTSGTTANECSKALLAAGADQVFVYTLARAISQGPGRS